MSANPERIITTRVLWSMGAGLIPLPLVDIAAVTAIQVDMLNALAKQHGVEFSADSGKSLVAALTGGTIARIGASLLKGIPGIGSLIGGISMSVMSGASTYAVGQVAARHLEAHGTLFDVDIRWAKQTYDQEFEQGKRVAKDLKAKEGAAKTVFEQLDQLGALRDKGILTQEEFDTKKALLLDQIG
jgi:uncharacterized protein (DUF697 family)